MANRKSTYFGQTILQPWLQSLQSQNESGTIIGFPNSGVNRALTNALDDMGLSEVTRTIDLSISPSNHREFLKQVREVVGTWVNQNVKYIQVNRLKLSRKSGIRQLKVLNAIRDENRRSFNYIFHLNDHPLIINPDLVRSDYSHIILLNTVYFPLSSCNEFDFLINQLSQRYQCLLKPEIIQQIYDLTGGNPFLVKYVVMRYAQYHNLDSDEEMLEMARLSLSNVSHRHLQILKNPSQSKSNEISSLQQMGVLDTTNHIKSALITRVIKDIKVDTKLNYDPNKNQIIFDHQDISSLFLPNEFEILKQIIINTRIDRQQVIDISYGVNSSQDVSDYAIDKIISRLRTKLVRLGFPSGIIKTIRRFGYRLNYNH